MFAELTETLGSGGLGVLMIIASLSMVAWLPAIAAVVVSQWAPVLKVVLFLLLSVFPPTALAVLVVAVRNGDVGDTPKRQHSRRHPDRHQDRQSQGSRCKRWRMAVAAPRI